MIWSSWLWIIGRRPGRWHVVLKEVTVSETGVEINEVSVGNYRGIDTARAARDHMRSARPDLQWSIWNGAPS